MKPKILFVPGIFNPKFYQTFWSKEAVKQWFEFIEFQNTFYSYWSFQKMKEMIKEGVQIIKKHQNDELIIICHSFGWILINCILQKIKASKIKKIITLASPLQMEIFWMKKRKQFLGYDKNLSFPAELYTYWGYLDPVVPYIWTNYKNNKSHKNIFAEHMYFLFSKKFIKGIIDKYKK